MYFRDTSWTKQVRFCYMTFRDTSRTFRDTSQGLFEIHQKYYLFTFEIFDNDICKSFSHDKLFKGLCLTANFRSFGYVNSWKDSHIHFMTASEKRKKQWKQASRNRKEMIKTYKLSTPKKYQQARVGLNRSNRKVYSNKVNSGSAPAKLARYHRLLNKFDKNRRLIEYKIDTTRDRSLMRALDKAKRNKVDSKCLEILADLAEIQKSSVIM